MVKRIIYCETCERFVELKRKSFNHRYHELLCIMFLTVFLIPLYFFLKYSKKKNTCPNCETIFDLNNLPKPPEHLSITSEFE
ncbi:MAG: hypothetical protein ACFFDO_03670 [Candidatus Thorarchaeota archaeon]